MGGMNFFDFGANNHDIMFRIRGALTQELSILMDLDWGYKLNREDYEDPWAIHFTLGHAF